MVSVPGSSHDGGVASVPMSFLVQQKDILNLCLSILVRGVFSVQPSKGGVASFSVRFNERSAAL